MRKLNKVLIFPAVLLGLACDQGLLAMGYGPVRYKGRQDRLLGKSVELRPYQPIKEPQTFFVGPQPDPTQEIVGTYVGFPGGCDAQAQTEAPCWQYDEDGTAMSEAQSKLFGFIQMLAKSCQIFGRDRQFRDELKGNVGNFASFLDWCILPQCTNLDDSIAIKIYWALLEFFDINEAFLAQCANNPEWLIRFFTDEALWRLMMNNFLELFLSRL